jgi:hypothetical protein
LKKLNFSSKTPQNLTKNFPPKIPENPPKKTKPITHACCKKHAPNIVKTWHVKTHSKLSAQRRKAAKNAVSRELTNKLSVGQLVPEKNKNTCGKEMPKVRRSNKTLFELEFV